MTRLALTALCGTLLFAQAPLQFEVASLKPSQPGQTNGIIRPMPGNQRYVGTNVPLRVLMTVAYSVTDRQISGGPDWIAKDPFDLDAKAAQPGSVDDLHVMLQHLLEERFQLKIRREKREQAVWELVPEKGGPKLPEHDAADKNYPPIAGGPRGIKGTNVTMEYFAFMLSRFIDRTVIDKTGLTSRYDVNLEFQLDRGPAGPAPDAAALNSDAPGIFTALREQLGLKLVPAKGPVEYLVIEHAEKPSEN